MYWLARDLFCSLKQKPDWLTATEWVVLKFYYLSRAPCEPQLAGVLQKAATELKTTFGCIQTREQAFAIARTALNSGIRKVRQQMERPQEVAEPASVPEVPYWAK